MKKNPLLIFLNKLKLRGQDFRVFVKLFWKTLKKQKFSCRSLGSVSWMGSKMAEKKLTRRLFLRDLMVTCACSGLYVNTLAVRHALGKTPEPPASGEPINMEYRPLGRTGLKVSAISFGVMRVTEPAVLLKALEMGINYFDTAHGEATVKRCWAKCSGNTEEKRPLLLQRSPPTIGSSE